MLGRVYGDIGESVLSREGLSRAYQLRDRAGDREKFMITANYDRQVTGNLEKAHQTLALWAQTYPRDVGPHGLLSGFTSQGAGKYEQSIEEAKKAIGLDPDFTPGYLNLAFAYACLDRLTEAESALQRASERKLDIPDTLILRYYIAFLKGDEAGMRREAALAKRQAWSGRLDVPFAGTCPGPIRSPATGKDDVAACSGIGSPGGPAGKSGHVAGILRGVAPWVGNCFQGAERG
jgi:tetratricopeptide (TPR) repeat protein